MKQISIYLWKDIVQEKRWFMFNFSALDEADDVSILWNIKNAEQLNEWIKEDLNQFLKVMNELWKQ